MNDAPVASVVVLPDGIEDTSTIITAAQLLAGAFDVDSTGLTVTSLSLASGEGTLVDNHNGTWTYTPTTNYNGPVFFNYTVTDGSLYASASASLNLTAVDDATVASPIALPSSWEDTPVTITGAQLLAGSFDPDGSDLTVTSLSISIGGGTLFDNHDGTWTYTPKSNYNGPFRSTTRLLTDPSPRPQQPA